MAKSKWNEVKEKLSLIECWARDGLTDEQISNNLGISKTTFYKFKAEHIELSELLKKGKEVVDYKVENALLKRAMGYDYEEETYESRFNRESGEYEEVLTKRVKKHVQPDTTAQIFWLKNRKPDVWRDKQEIKHSGEINNPFSEMSTEELRKLINE